MNINRILREWPVFRRELDTIIRSDRLMKLNFDFNLHPDFHRTDLDSMTDALDAALHSLRVIQEELQHG